MTKGTRRGITPSGDSSVNESPHKGFEVGGVDLLGYHKNTSVYEQVIPFSVIYLHRFPFFRNVMSVEG